MDSFRRNSSFSIDAVGDHFRSRASSRSPAVLSRMAVFCCRCNTASQGRGELGMRRTATSSPSPAPRSSTQIIRNWPCRSPYCIASASPHRKFAVTSLSRAPLQLMLLALAICEKVSQAASMPEISTRSSTRRRDSFRRSIIPTSISNFGRSREHLSPNLVAFSNPHPRVLEPVSCSFKSTLAGWWDTHAKKRAKS
jgi:hypothetical protein